MSEEKIAIIGSDGAGKTALTAHQIAEMHEVQKIAEEIQPTKGIETDVVDLGRMMMPSSYGDVMMLKEQRKQSRLYWKVWNHCRANGNTLMEEYQLILDKKSTMTRQMRDYLQAVMEYVPTPEEVAEMEARDKRIAEYNSSQEEE